MSKITTLDEFEVAYKEGLGRPLAPRYPWRTVSEEWLSRFADGAGDYNPLFSNADYADSGLNHMLVSPPGFVFSIDFGANASIWGHIPESEVSMKDLTILYAGASVEFHRPIRLGDRVRSFETPSAIRRTVLPQLGDALICTGVTEYWNDRGEQVATVTNHMFRFANMGHGVASTPVDGAPKPRIAPDPLVWERARRGAQPRYWESVVEEQQIDDLPKGTYTTTELYLFTHGALSTRRARKVDEGTIDMGAGGRADPEYARGSRAQSGSFDYGPQRICWLLQATTDWMGDHGTLLHLDARLRRPNLVGDTNTVRGKVARTYVDGDDHLVELHLENVNHAGTVTASGTATVKLPTEGAIRTDPFIFNAPTDSTPGIYQ
jgi:acyl dehydratase